MGICLAKQVGLGSSHGGLNTALELLADQGNRGRRRYSALHGCIITRLSRLFASSAHAVNDFLEDRLGILELAGGTLANDGQLMDRSH